MWGDGLQTRSFTFIDECVEGVLRYVCVSVCFGYTTKFNQASLLPVLCSNGESTLYDDDARTVCTAD